MRKKVPVKAIVRAGVPLVLFIVFALALSFPEYVPFFQIRHEKHEGIGSVVYVVPSGAGSIDLVMKKVPAGTAPRGCTDEPGGTVVRSPFLLARTETSNRLWSAVCERAEKHSFLFSGLAIRGNAPDAPVEGVSWRDAVVWCNALSVQLSLTPVYYEDDACTEPVRSFAWLEFPGDAVAVKADADGFRLPASAEWEFAARYLDGFSWTPGSHPSGSADAYHLYVQSAGYAVFDAESAAPCASLAPNRLGIYDMSGNVWEWCFDQMPDPLSTTGFDSEGKRVVRGGSWAGNAYRLQIGGEFGSLPDAVEQGQGFRVARTGWQDARTGWQDARTGRD